MGLLEGSDLSMVDYIRSKAIPTGNIAQQPTVDTARRDALHPSRAGGYNQWLRHMMLVWYGPLAASMFEPGVPWSFTGEDGLKVYGLIAHTIQKLEQLPGYKHLLPILHYEDGTVYSSRFERALNDFTSTEDVRVLDLNMTKQLFSAVQYLHASGFCHNAIDASKIVYTGDNYYLTNFETVTPLTRSKRTNDLNMLCRTLLSYALPGSEIHRILSNYSAAGSEEVFAPLFVQLGIPSFNALTDQMSVVCSAERKRKLEISAEV